MGYEGSSYCFKKLLTGVIYFLQCSVMYFYITDEDTGKCKYIGLFSTCATVFSPFILKFSVYMCCIQGYFQPVLFLPSYIFKRFCFVLNSPKLTLTKKNNEYNHTNTCTKSRNKSLLTKAPRLNLRKEIVKIHVFDQFLTIKCSKSCNLCNLHMQSHIKSFISSSELFQKLFLFKTLKFILSLGSWDLIT